MGGRHLALKPEGLARFPPDLGAWPACPLPFSQMQLCLVKGYNETRSANKHFGKAFLPVKCEAWFSSSQGPDPVEGEAPSPPGPELRHGAMHFSSIYLSSCAITRWSIWHR